jgi:hypothetical protein
MWRKKAGTLAMRTYCMCCRSVDDSPCGGVLHHREAAVPKRGMGASEQIVRPGGNGAVRLARRAEDGAVELD